MLLVKFSSRSFRLIQAFLIYQVRFRLQTFIKSSQTAFGFIQTLAIFKPSKALVPVGQTLIKSFQIEISLGPQTFIYRVQFLSRNCQNLLNIFKLKFKIISNKAFGLILKLLSSSEFDPYLTLVKL